MADHSETINFVDGALVRLVPAGASMHPAVGSGQPQQQLVEGQFTGSIELDASSRIEVAAGAEIQAEVLRAHTVVVRCYVTGTIHAQVVEIASTARVTGTVQYDARLSIEPGARVRASIESPGSDAARRDHGRCPPSCPFLPAGTGLDPLQVPSHPASPGSFGQRATSRQNRPWQIDPLQRLC